MGYVDGSERTRGQRPILDHPDPSRALSNEETAVRSEGQCPGHHKTRGNRFDRDSVDALDESQRRSGVIIARLQEYLALYRTRTLSVGERYRPTGYRDEKRGADNDERKAQSS